MPPGSALQRCQGNGGAGSEHLRHPHVPGQPSRRGADQPLLQAMVQTWPPVAPQATLIRLILTIFKSAVLPLLIVPTSFSALSISPPSYLLLLFALRVSEWGYFRSAMPNQCIMAPDRAHLGNSLSPRPAKHWAGGYLGLLPSWAHLRGHMPGSCTGLTPA